MERIGKELLKKIERIASIGHWQWNVINDKVTLSDECYRILGITQAEFKGTYDSFLNMIHPDDKERFDTIIYKAASNNLPFYMEHKIIQPDGSIRYIRENGEMAQEDVMLTTFHDITIQKQYEEELEALAFRDPGTDLYNKRFFVEHLSMTLNNCTRKNESAALIIIDLDDFSGINNTHGHLVGDIVLKKIAVKIKNEFSRTTDVVARLGGDEFAILCTGIDFENLHLKCTHLINKMNESIIIKNLKIVQTASMGLCYKSEGNTNISTDEFFECADSLMYSVKKDGKNAFSVDVT